MTRWTPELLDAVREKAAAGRTSQQAARELGVSVASLRYVASERGISFHGQRYQQRAERIASPPTEAELQEAVARMREAAIADLRQEIALAIAEAPTAHLYRGGWPE